MQRIVEGNRIPLTKEVERLDLYLSLESMRFKDKFKYEIKTNNLDTEAISIPAMLLQPFVENSIIHGVLPRNDEDGWIKVDMIVENGVLVISIYDNGIGIGKSIIKKENSKGDHKSQGNGNHGKKN